MKNIKTLYVIIIVVLVGAGTFFGGMQYQKSKQPAGLAGRNGQGGFGRGNVQGQRPVSGDIISQDSNSVTVKLQDGSSKIIILSGTTTINKATAGSVSDLKIGERVTAFGTANSDGSVTAQNLSVGTMFRGTQPAGQ